MDIGCESMVIGNSKHNETQCHVPSHGVSYCMYINPRIVTLRIQLVLLPSFPSALCELPLVLG